MGLMRAFAHLKINFCNPETVPQNCVGIVFTGYVIIIVCAPHMIHKISLVIPRDL